MYLPPVERSFMYPFARPARALEAYLKLKALNIAPHTLRLIEYTAPTTVTISLCEGARKTFGPAVWHAGARAIPFSVCPRYFDSLKLDI